METDNRLEESPIAVLGFMSLFVLSGIGGVLGTWFFWSGEDTLGVFFPGLMVLAGVWGILDGATRLFWDRLVVTSAGIRGSRVGQAKVHLPWTSFGEVSRRTRFGVVVAKFDVDDIENRDDKWLAQTLYLSPKGASTLDRLLKAGHMNDGDL